MVQRKEPETRRSQHVKLERQSSCQQHQDVLKKKMKLERSIRAADLESLQDSPPMKPKRRSPVARGSPNYMKPTSSSGAKTEQPQVTPQSNTPTNKKRSPKNSNSSKTPSPLSVSLSRQSSLKAIRPLIKKRLMKGGAVVNRATCSSTLKDLRFPEALDLNPGGTETEGTSVMRVCPYTYCSLNGHRHEPLPPLKCFVSARRKLLKTQKSMKLKGLNPLREKAKVLEKDKEEIDTGQKAASKVPSCLEIEEPDDFFVEIYTTSNPEEQVIKEIVEDGVDQSSEVSNEEGDVVMSFLEYVECDQQAEEAEEAKISSLAPERNEEDGMVESESKVSTLDFNWEEEGSPSPDNITECSECPDDRSGLMPPQAESSINAEVEADTEQQQEVNQEAEEDGDAVSCYDELFKERVPVNESTVDEVVVELKQQVSQNVAGITPDDGNFKANDNESREREEFCREDPESTEENDGKFNLCYSNENIFDTSFSGCEEGVPEEPEESSQAAHGDVKLDNNESSVLKPDSSEEQQIVLKENIKEEENEKEVARSMSTVQFFNSSDKLEESDQGMTEDDCNRNQPQVLLSTVQFFNSSDKLEESDQGMTEDDCNRNQPQLVIECEDATEDASVSSDIQSCSSNDQSDESDAGESWESENEQLEEMSPLDGSIAKPKARRRTTTKKIIEEPDNIREFNPRAPNFLDVEPDPEAEKVDLRHQMMDERKNAEEYLIDYALRRAVTKLAPDRKKKVAVLVEAFEAVMPLPVHEKPIRRAVSDFILTRMQACS